MSPKQTGRPTTKKGTDGNRESEWSPINGFEALKTGPALTAVGSHEKPRYNLSDLTTSMRRQLEADEMTVARRYMAAMQRTRETGVGSPIEAEILDMAYGVSRRAFATPMKGERFTGATAIHAGLCVPATDPGNLRDYGYYLPAPLRTHILPFDDFLSDGSTSNDDLPRLLGGLPEGVLNVYSMHNSLSVEFADAHCENAVVGGFATIRRKDMVWWTAVGGVLVDFDDVERQLKTFVFKGLDHGKDRTIKPKVVTLSGRPDAWKQRLCGVVDLSGRELNSVCEWFLDPEIRIERDVTGTGPDDDVFRHLKKSAMLCLHLPAHFTERPTMARRIYSLTPSGLERIDEEPRSPSRGQ